MNTFTSLDESGSAFFSIPFMAITKAQFEAASFSSCFEQGEWDPGLYGQYKRKLDEAEETAISLAMLDHGFSLTRQFATRGLSPFSPPSAKYRKTCIKADGRVAARVSDKREVTKERTQATSTQAGGVAKEELFFHCQLAAHRGWQQCHSDLREKEITFTNVNNRIQQLRKAIMDTKDYFPSDWFLHPEDHMDNVLFRRTYLAMKERFDALDHQKKLLLKHEKQVEAKIAARKAGIMDEGNIFNTFIDRTLEPIMAPVLGRGWKRLLLNHEEQVEAAKYRKTSVKADGRVAARVSDKGEVTKERSQATSTQARGITKEELFFHCQLAAHRGLQQCQSDLREKEITFTTANNHIEQLSKAIMDTKDYFPSEWFLHPEDHMDNDLFRRTYVAMKKRFDALDHFYSNMRNK